MSDLRDVCDHMVLRILCKQCKGTVLLTPVPPGAPVDVLQGQEAGPHLEMLVEPPSNTVRVGELRAILRDEAQFVTWMASIERYVRRVNEYKASVGAELAKVREAESDLKAKADAFADGVEMTLNQVNERVEMVHVGLVRLEQRVTAAWNTFNVLVETLAELGVGGSRDQLQERMLVVGARLMEEATSHQRAERARIAEERRAGVDPAPMTTAPTLSVASAVAGDVADRAATFRAEMEGLDSTRGKRTN